MLPSRALNVWFSGRWIRLAFVFSLIVNCVLIHHLSTRAAAPVLQPHRRRGRGGAGGGAARQHRAQGAEPVRQRNRRRGRGAAGGDAARQHRAQDTHTHGKQMWDVEVDVETALKRSSTDGALSAASAAPTPTQGTPAYVCMYVCMYVCTVCMCVRMCVCMYMYLLMYVYASHTKP